MGLLSSPLGFTLRDHFAGSADDPFRVATPGVNVSRHAADEGNGEGGDEARITVDGRTLRSSPLAGHADDGIFDPVPPADYSPIG